MELLCKEKGKISANLNKNPIIHLFIVSKRLFLMRDKCECWDINRDEFSSNVDYNTISKFE